MNLKNLQKANQLQFGLIDFYLDRLKRWYPQYLILRSFDHDEFIIFHLKSNLEENIYEPIYIHYTQLCDLSE